MIETHTYQPVQMGCNFWIPYPRELTTGSQAKSVGTSIFLQISDRILDIIINALDLFCLNFFVQAAINIKGILLAIEEMWEHIFDAFGDLVTNHWGENQLLINQKSLEDRSRDLEAVYLEFG